MRKICYISGTRADFGLMNFFKGEKGERCHLLALSNISHSGIAIRSAMELLIAARNEMTRCSTSWLFVNQQGTKMSFGDMNDIVLDQLELVKELDEIKINQQVA